MGTRHLIAVVKDQDFKIAQYAQWDGYPGGAGVDVLEFLKKKGNPEALEEALSRVRFLDEERDKDFLDDYNRAAARPGPRSEEQVEWFESFISRDVGSDILKNVAFSEEKEILLEDSRVFAGDSLFCEWAYLIDFDTKVLEVYKGFNKTPVTEGRFLSSDETLERSEGYEPIKLWKTYSLNNLPTTEEMKS